MPYILKKFKDNPFISLQDKDVKSKFIKNSVYAGTIISFPVLVNYTQGNLVDFKTGLTEEQQRELLDSFSPELEECIDQVIYWLETKRIVLTGEQDEIGDYDYEDYRTEEEKKSKLWLTVLEDKKTVLSSSKNTFWDKFKDRKWWEFWK